MKYYSLGKFADLIGVSPQTLRNWDKEGKLKPDHKKPSGYRYYSEKQLNEILGIKANKDKKITVGYCRVSSSKQKDDLNRQIENVSSYMIAKGYSFEIISDVGSGINYNKKGLNKLLEMIIHQRVDKIVILYKDRLVRFGYELLESICHQYNVEIEIIDNTPKTEQEELVEDLIQIVTVFSCKLNGKRAHKAKKIISELIDDEEGNQSSVISN